MTSIAVKRRHFLLTQGGVSANTAMSAIVVGGAGKVWCHILRIVIGKLWDTAYDLWWLKNVDLYHYSI